MSSARREPKLSWKGYVLLNLIVAGFLVGIHYATKGFIGSKPLYPWGLAPILFFVWLCFGAASIYDAFFDRYAERVDQRTERESLADPGVPRD